MDEIAKGLHDESIKPENLSQKAILKTYSELNKGAAEGYGDNWTNYDQDKDSLNTVQSLKKNLYSFSGAKTFAMQQEMNILLHKEGKIKPFNEFKDDVMKLNPTYNKTYLKAEFQTARSTGNHVRNWQQFQKNKDIFPNLQYKTVNDDRVRPQHQLLSDIIKPVDDPFWNTYYPTNGFRCRCYVVQTSEQPSGGNYANPNKYGVDPSFQNNAAKSGAVYNRDKHPYFALAKSGAKKVAQEMERSKMNAPYDIAYKSDNGSKVKVNPFADLKDLQGNYQAAIRISEGLGLNVNIRPHLDGRIIKGEKNPEYEISGKLADRKVTKNGNVSNLLSKANKQGVEIVVIDLMNTNLSADQIRNNVKNVLKHNVHPNIKSVIIINKDGNNVEIFKREEL